MCNDKWRVKIICVFVHYCHRLNVTILDVILNTTIEERVSLLEIQVTDLEENVADLDQDVNFMFDEQVIQDERLLSLDEDTDTIEEQLFTIYGELDGELV